MCIFYLKIRYDQYEEHSKRYEDSMNLLFKCLARNSSKLKYLSLNVYFNPSTENWGYKLVAQNIKHHLKHLERICLGDNGRIQEAYIKNIV